MTEASARTWLSSRQDVIPALEVHHRRALGILEDKNKTLRELADVILLDPGMSVSVYHAVNGKLKDVGKPAVDSVQAVLTLLSDNAIADLVTRHKVLDETREDAPRRRSYYQLISRAYHLLAQLDGFASIQGIRAINEIHSAAVLHDIGEFCACLFDHERYLLFQQKFGQTDSTAAAFDFSFHDLGRVYAEMYCLPPPISESLEDKPSSGRKARLIQLAADVSHHAELGWHHSSTKAAGEACAAYLNRPPQSLDTHIQTVAIDCARASPLDDVLPAAARLVMLPDLEPPKKPAPKPAVDDPDPGGQKFEHRIKALLQTSQPSQARLLDLLLSHLHRDLQLTRVALMLLSPDQKELGTRAGKGIDQRSPIRTLAIEISNTGVLKSLMTKSQALWVESDSYKSYAAALPEKFKSAFLHESFYLMSLHVNGKPLGLIYADRSVAVDKLDKDAYIKFKSAILLAGKALTYLLKQRRQTAT